MQLFDSIHSSFGQALRFSIILALLMSAGCASKAELETRESEVKALRLELQALKNEIDTVKFGSRRLLTQAESEFKKGHYQAAMNSATILTSKHPESSEVGQASQIIERSRLAITQEKKEAKRRTELAVREAQRRQTESRKTAEAKVRQEKERIARALRNMRTEVDEIKGVTWYYDRSSPRFINSRSAIYAYMGREKGGMPSLRLKNIFVNEDWLFIRQYTIKADSQPYTIDPPQYGDGSVEQDNSGGDIWEWIDIPVQDRELEILRAIAGSRKAVIRYEGKQYYQDRTISNAEKQAIKNVLAAKEFLEKKSL
jgi:hypothetical protein